ELPDGNFTAYLEPNKVAPQFEKWQLLGGTAQEGISHHVPERTASPAPVEIGPAGEGKTIEVSVGQTIRFYAVEPDGKGNWTAGLDMRVSAEPSDLIFFAPDGGHGSKINGARSTTITFFTVRPGQAQLKLQRLVLSGKNDMTVEK